jgi:hypothetical protein
MPNGLIFLGPLYEAHWGLPQEVTLPADMAITFRP